MKYWRTAEGNQDIWFPLTVDEQLEVDKMIFGAAYYTKDSDGGKIRIDPTKIVIERKKKRTLWRRIKCFFSHLVSHGTI